MNYNWLVKVIKRQEWDEFYSQNNTYTYLGKVGRPDTKGVIRGGIKIGFLNIADKIPEFCRLATEEELKEIKIWREDNNIYPRPK